MAQAGIRYFSAVPNFFDRIGTFMVEWQFTLRIEALNTQARLQSTSDPDDANSESFEGCNG